ncbi:Uncharacterized conserved protein PhnB, glyoxalase superfamily [Roseovarius nanhaiticus]|uniref:Bleomycin resistance protein n=1 Tax=Roseovarius nanhaiticus TaxID=573024 RepID=A0A1N7FX02_9RHOB|nr:glyoxalase superfamily protein [Roseovarius nanhaiticus]SEK43185.1 Uncharacterized conserved protein PhnB, glyoxalase superfamily [Roseovarius nanhaiticus]SIS04850.1 Uncharacterized conserved protein PhnB, glyoxalase superfamily [Roseovarius nanhaiticus]
MRMRPPIPILRSFDEAAARAFYVDFLGFDVEFEHRFDVDAPLYLSLRLGDCVLHVSEHHGDATPGAALRIEVEDVEAYCAALNAKRYKFARPGVQDQPWGFKDMSITDPAGNKLIFCTPSET